MYKEKNKSYFIIAIIYWIIYMISLLLMGVLYKRGFKYYYIIYLLIALIGIITVIIKDKNIKNLGFRKDKIKVNLIISFIIIFLTFITSIILSDYSLLKLIKGSLYYLLYVALLEEIIFRGFIQNYLFGLKCKKYIIFVIGALLFSLIHIPFQMYVHNNVSLNYIIECFPQLIFCFVFHLVMCFITYKRKDITVSVSIHFVIDFIQSVL